MNMETIDENYSIDDKKMEDKVYMVMTQTIYDRETAIKKLKEFDNQPMSVIKDYFGILKSESNNRSKNTKSLNQKIYGEFRKFLEIEEKKTTE